MPRRRWDLASRLHASSPRGERRHEGEPRKRTGPPVEGASPIEKELPEELANDLFDLKISLKSLPQLEGASQIVVESPMGKLASPGGSCFPYERGSSSKRGKLPEKYGKKG